MQPSGETKPWRGQDIRRPRARYRPDSPDQYGTDERTSAGCSDHGARPPGEHRTLINGQPLVLGAGAVEQFDDRPVVTAGRHRPDSDIGAGTVAPAAMTARTGG